MNLLKQKNSPKQSLAAFKNSAAAITDNAAIEKITGGAMSGCHRVGGGKLADFNTTIRTTGAF